MPMVSWQTLVRLAFKVAEAKDASFDGIEDGGDFLSQLSTVWKADKDMLLQMTEDQAIDYLDDRVSK